MSKLNETPLANRLHIALFGKTNAGKSSVINALTNQNISLVSDVKGTTTDPVYKAMELLPIGPIVLIDTAGLDDESKLGELRKNKTLEVLNKTDIAIVVIDAVVGPTQFDIQILETIKSKKLPFITVLNKTDLITLPEETIAEFEKLLGLKLLSLSSKTKIGIDELKNKLIKSVPDNEDKFRILGILFLQETLLF